MPVLKNHVLINALPVCLSNGIFPKRPLKPMGPVKPRQNADAAYITRCFYALNMQGGLC
jgi:hypothetical protein